jgi:hypothetical protein
VKRVAAFALALQLLTGCTVHGVDVEQEKANGLAGELLDGHTFGQTFALQHDGLYRIDLYTATYARENSHPVIFRVKTAPGASDDLVTVELPAAQISNSGPTVITFLPLASTAGHNLYFSIESPGSAPGNAITVYRSEEDIYPDGEMFLDGRAVEGDVAFIAHVQEHFTLAEIWDDFASRARQDRPFFAFYCTLLALIVIALVVTSVWPNLRTGRVTHHDPAAEEKQ